MAADLPSFPYHPNPIATGSVVASDKECKCCAQSRGFIYTASVYAEADLNESICPWCIADGSAAEKFNATFVDAHPLHQAGLSEDVIAAVTKRTPGYFTWQQEVWLSCCSDACAFAGDATEGDLSSIEDDVCEQLLSYLGFDEDDWDEFVESYTPGGDPAVYKFVCRHCRKQHYNADFS